MHCREMFAIADISSASNSSDDDEWSTVFDDQLMSLKKLENIYGVLIQVLLPLGLLGNFLSVMVYSRKAFSRSPPALIFKILAISDTMFLFIFTVPHVVMYYTLMWPLTSWFCRVWIFLTALSKHYSSIIIAFMSCDRVIAILFPHKYKIISTLKQIKVVLSVSFS